MTKCRICDSEVSYKMYKNTLLGCSNCSHVWANLCLDKEQLKEVYSEKYFQGEEYSDYIEEKAALQKNFVKRLSRLRKLNIQLDKYSNIIEIGCAYGFFGEIIRDNLAIKNYTGLDVAKEAIDYGKNELNLHLENVDYLEFISPSPATDVFMWDVIEHLNDPREYLAKAYDDLDEGGHVYITTGDISALLARIQKEKWRMIHPPSHLQYFSRQSITKLLESLNFQVVDITYPTIYRRIYQILYLIFKLHKRNNKVLQSIVNSVSKNWYIPINTFDVMYVIARK